MRFEKMKYGAYTFTCLVLVCCCGCKNDDPETPPAGSYTKEWVLDVNEYLGASAGKIYEAAVIDDSRMLVSYNNGTTGSLVEINYVDGTIIRQTPTENDSLHLVKSGEQVLMVHEQADEKAYTVGLYDPENDNPVKVFPTLQRQVLSPEGGQLMGYALDPPETIYTYGSMEEDGEQKLWIANWYFDGAPRWTTVVNDHTSAAINPSTVEVKVATNNHEIGRKLVFTVETEIDGRKHLSMMSVDASDGYLNWMYPPSMPVHHMVENHATGWLYAFYPMGYSKLAPDGDETFMSPMSDFTSGTLTTRPLVLYTSKIFLAVHEGNDITLACINDNETRWTEDYWEKSPLPLILLSSSQLDAVLVVSSTGFVTKYGENK
jgi:hypothetical protein